MSKNQVPSYLPTDPHDFDQAIEPENLHIIDNTATCMPIDQPTQLYICDHVNECGVVSCEHNKPHKFQSLCAAPCYRTDGVCVPVDDESKGLYSMSVNTNTMSKETEEQIIKVCDNLADMLISKNRKYGDSALSPISVFSKTSPTGALLVRMDDKVSRIRNSEELDRDDLFDLLGYGVLIAISKGWTEYEVGTEKL